MKCDYCEEDAIVNYQKCWKRFLIDESEDYELDEHFDSSEIQEPTGQDNLHLCKEHEQKFLDGVV